MAVNTRLKLEMCCDELFRILLAPATRSAQNAKLQFQFQNRYSKENHNLRASNLIKHFLDKVFDCGVVKLIACY